MTDPSTTTETTRPSLRQRLWSSKQIRGAIVGFGVLLSVVIPTSSASAASCTAFEREYGLACSTPAPVKKCTANVAGAGAVGALFGGPLGFLAGVAGGLVGCGTDTLG